MKLIIQTPLLAILLTGFGSLAQASDAMTGHLRPPRKTQPTAGDVVAVKPTFEVPGSTPGLATIQKELEGWSPEARSAKLTQYREKFGAKNARNVKPPQQLSAEEWQACTPEQKNRQIEVPQHQGRTAPPALKISH